MRRGFSVRSREWSRIWWRLIIRSRVDLRELDTDLQIVPRWFAIPFGHSPIASTGSLRGDQRLCRPQTSSRDANRLSSTVPLLPGSRKLVADSVRVTFRSAKQRVQAPLVRAEGGGRTRMGREAQRILSPLRLPIPPPRRWRHDHICLRRCQWLSNADAPVRHYTIASPGQ